MRILYKKGSPVGSFLFAILNRISTLISPSLLLFYDFFGRYKNIFSIINDNYISPSCSFVRNRACNCFEDCDMEWTRQ